MKPRLYFLALLCALAVAVTMPDADFAVGEPLLPQETMNAHESVSPLESALRPEDAPLSDDNFQMAPLTLTRSLSELTETSLRFFLAAAFDPVSTDSGKIWAIRTHVPSEGYVLIDGLSQDIGLCFDSAHDFLYVSERRKDDSGRISQYKIYHDKDNLVREKTDPVIIYKGETVSSCAVDALGNLYFALPRSIAFASFPDLWGGFTNEFDSLYAGTRDRVIAPTDLAVADGWVFWVTAGKELVRAPDRFNLGKAPEATQRDTVSIAATRTYVYETFSNGSIAALNSTAHLTDLSSPRAKCASADRAYIVDVSSKSLAVFRSGRAEVVAVVAGLSDVECVFSWTSALGAAGALFIF